MKTIQHCFDYVRHHLGNLYSPSEARQIAFALVGEAASLSLAEMLINKDTKCGKRGADKLIYCADKQGTPITGNVHKLKGGFAIRRYAFNEGYLNGISEIYDDYGHLLETRPYKNGILNGTLYQYNRRGKIVAAEPYINGKKEGIATYTTDKNIHKIIYVEDKSNGNMIVYDRKWIEFDVTPEIADGTNTVKRGKAVINKLLQNKNKTGIIYRIINTNSEATKGKYFYLNCPDKTEDCVPTIVNVDIPPLILNGINNGCLQIHESLNFSACAVKTEICNSEWANRNRNYLQTYFNNCR